MGILVSGQGWPEFRDIVTCLAKSSSANIDLDKWVSINPNIQQYRN